MSSRQEEKERRRQERIARERADAQAASRGRRLQLVGGVLLGVAAVAAIVVAVVIGLGGDDDGGGSASAGDAAAVALPAQRTSDLKQAARAAGCKLTNATFEGQSHAEKEFRPADYKTNPPTSGAHTPTWYEDGIYAPGTVPKLGKLVHTLEHGRINVQYKRGTATRTVGQLEALLAEQSDGYHMLLYENTTGMDAAVAATAWTQSLTCPAMNDKVFDALRAFRARYIDKGPEKIP